MVAVTSGPRVVPTTASTMGSLAGVSTSKGDAAAAVGQVFLERRCCKVRFRSPGIASRCKYR
jgi:hypothetical protein